MKPSSYLALFLAMPVLIAAAPGTPFPKERPASPDEVTVGRTALASELYGRDGMWLQTSLPVAGAAIFLRAQSGAFCGDVGCPAAVLVRSRAGWSAAWTGMASDVGSVLATEHHGLRDIALGMPNGFLVLIFDGKRYVQTRE